MCINIQSLWLLNILMGSFHFIILHFLLPHPNIFITCLHSPVRRLLQYVNVGVWKLENYTIDFVWIKVVQRESQGRHVEEATWIRKTEAAINGDEWNYELAKPSTTLPPLLGSAKDDYTVQSRPRCRRATMSPAWVLLRAGIVHHLHWWYGDWWLQQTQCTTGIFRDKWWQAISWKLVRC